MLSGAANPATPDLRKPTTTRWTPRAPSPRPTISGSAASSEPNVAALLL
jgi:hypothetical protein